MTQPHSVPDPTARPQTADEIAADLIARCPEHGHSTEAFPECRCAAARKAAAWLAENPGPDDASPERITQYGFRLRDSTLLTFDTKSERDRRMADFVAAEWQVTPLTRWVRPAQYGEWAEETVGAGGEQA